MRYAHGSRKFFEVRAGLSSFIPTDSIRDIRRNATVDDRVVIRMPSPTMDGAIVTDAGSRLPGRRRIIALLALAGLLQCASEGLAQESNDAKDGVRLQTTSVGIGRYARGKWGVRGVEVANRSDAPADVEADVTIGGDPLMEFARRAWLPSRSRRRMAIPIQPAGDESDQIQVRTGAWRSSAKFRQTSKTHSSRSPAARAPTPAAKNRSAGEARPQ